MVAQSCLTLCNPTDCSPPGSSVRGILQARRLEWVAILFSKGSSPPRDQTQTSCIASRFFFSFFFFFLPSEPQGSRQLKKLSLKETDWVLCPSPEGAGVTLSVEARPCPSEARPALPSWPHFLAPNVRPCVPFLPRPAHSDPQAGDLHRHRPLPLAPGGVSIPGARTTPSRRWEGEPNPAAH